jgi:hypothetical protein
MSEIVSRMHINRLHIESFANTFQFEHTQDIGEVAALYKCAINLDNIEQSQVCKLIVHLQVFTFMLLGTLLRRRAIQSTRIWGKHPSQAKEAFTA